MQSNAFKQLTNGLLSKLGLSMVNKKLHEQAVEKAECFESLIKSIPLTEAPFMSLLGQLSNKERLSIYSYLLLSKSQLAQDLFVISQSASPGFPRFFVEFGATNGVQLSNTYILEKHAGWKGILAEPAKTWHAALKANRSCVIDFNCISDQSNTMVEFIEAGFDPNDPIASPELSSMAAFAHQGDAHDARRNLNSKTYQVPTLSLNDLLAKHAAPKDIGYLSIDTEGSELSILANTDFNRYKFRIITVEHNFIDDKRSAIFNLLTQNHYHRIHESISRWDDWYVLTS